VNNAASEDGQKCGLSQGMGTSQKREIGVALKSSLEVWIVEGESVFHTWIVLKTERGLSKKTYGVNIVAGYIWVLVMNASGQVEGQMRVTGTLQRKARTW